MGNSFLKYLLTKMKLSVILALTATAAAGKCYKTAGEAGEAGETGLAAECTCAANCTTCLGEAGTAGEGEAGTNQQGEAKCVGCGEGYELTGADADTKAGKCTAKAAGEAAAGKALVGGVCDQDGDNKGCAEGLQCGLTAETTVGGVTTPAIEVCVATAGCVEPIVCGATKLGAALAAAVAIANYM